jgi:hypothetical protein
MNDEIEAYILNNTASLVSISLQALVPNSHRIYHSHGRGERLYYWHPGSDVSIAQYVAPFSLQDQPWLGRQ